ncbi:MAG: zinc ribbon domain-containing protein, partial [Saprospiraceae bacterium]|nr:zinc ribbon domain-containing protein [Saprospiraceae bacterium]
MDTGVLYCTNCGSANEVGTKFCYKCGTPIKTLQPPVNSPPTSDFITLACPKCGGQLEITPDMDRFACKYCGNEHLVRRSGSNISLAPVVEGIKRVEEKFDHALIGADRMAAEQTIQRLKNELPGLEKELQQKQSAYSILEKQVKIKPGKALIILGIILIFGFLIFGIMAGLSYQERHYELYDLLTVVAIISPAVGIVFVIAGAVKNRKSHVAELENGRREALEKARVEMERAKSFFDDH